MSLLWLMFFFTSSLSLVINNSYSKIFSSFGKCFHKREILHDDSSFIVANDSPNTTQIIRTIGSTEDINIVESHSTSRHSDIYRDRIVFLYIVIVIIILVSTLSECYKRHYRD